MNCIICGQPTDQTCLWCEEPLHRHEGRDERTGEIERSRCWIERKPLCPGVYDQATMMNARCPTHAYQEIDSLMVTWYTRPTDDIEQAALVTHDSLVRVHSFGYLVLLPFLSTTWFESWPNM